MFPTPSLAELYAIESLLYNSSECALIGNVGPERKHDWYEFQYGDGHDIA